MHVRGERAVSQRLTPEFVFIYNGHVKLEMSDLIGRWRRHERHGRHRMKLRIDIAHLGRLVSDLHHP